MPAHDAFSISQSIVELATPASLWVPSRQDAEPPAEIVVKPGQQIQAGELIARRKMSGSLNVHAAAAGEVLAIGTVDTARVNDVPAAHISVSPGPSRPPPQDIDIDQLRSTLVSINVLAVAAERAGVMNGRFSLTDELEKASIQKIDHIIINALPYEPDMTAGLAMFLNNLDASFILANVLKQGLRPLSMWLAVDAAETGVVRQCRAAGAGTAVRICPLTNKYPQANPALLAQVIAGKEVPHGASPFAAGVWVIEASAVAALAHAVIEPQPSAHVTVSISGNAATGPALYRIPIGTRLLDVVTHVGLKQPLGRIVEGGAMTGTAIHSLDTVVTKGTQSILLMDKNADRIATPSPCIHCGWCQEDCPVGLDPFALIDLFERQQWDRAARHHPLACIECGICSYICPTELPLAQSIKKLKARSGGPAHDESIAGERRDR